MLTISITVVSAYLTLQGVDNLHHRRSMLTLHCRMLTYLTLQDVDNLHHRRSMLTLHCRMLTYLTLQDVDYLHYRGQCLSYIAGCFKTPTSLVYAYLTLQDVDNLHHCWPMLISHCRMLTISIIVNLYSSYIVGCCKIFIIVGLCLSYIAGC